MNDTTRELLSWTFKGGTLLTFLTIIAMLILLARFWEVTLSGDKVCRCIGRYPLTPLILAEINFAAMILQFFSNRIVSVVSEVSTLKISTLTVMTDEIIIAIQVIVSLISLIYLSKCELEIYKTIPANDPVNNLFGVKNKKTEIKENKNEKN